MDDLNAEARSTGLGLNSSEGTSSESHAITFRDSRECKSKECLKCIHTLTSMDERGCAGLRNTLAPI